MGDWSGGVVEYWRDGVGAKIDYSIQNRIKKGATRIALPLL